LLALFVPREDDGRRGDRGGNGNEDVALCIQVSDRIGRIAPEQCARTLVPARRTLPSVLQLRVNGSPPTSSFDVQLLLRVSQNRTVPSDEQLANSNSRTGLNSTFSTAWPCPLNSV
jgi:hypothetical protein